MLSVTIPGNLLSGDNIDYTVYPSPSTSYLIPYTNTMDNILYSNLTPYHIYIRVRETVAVHPS